MNDAEYVFKQDSKEKKRIAASASKRVGKTRKVTLPYELMSKEERKKYMQASEVSVFKFRPMTMKEFKEVPGDKKVELLKWYGEKYGWNAMGISAALDVAYDTAAKLLDKHLLTGMFKARMKECTKEQKAQFMANRRELEYSRQYHAQNDFSHECETTQPSEEKPVQAAPAPVSGGFAIQLNCEKFGRTLELQLEGISRSLDPKKEYTVSLLIVELPSDGNERKGNIADS